MNSQDNKEKNFEKSVGFLKDSIKEKPDVICLSERFLYWGDEKQEEAETIDSKYIKYFQNFAKENQVNIVLGSVSVKIENSKKTTNTTFVVNRKGEIIHRYDKIYMFNVDKKDIKIQESDSTKSGKSFGIFELDGVYVGVGICYDLRYPEYFQALVEQGVEMIFLPANFRENTGKIAWDVLTKSRAIENQVYFCACGQTGGDGVTKRCANTRVVSYDGQIIDELGY